MQELDKIGEVIMSCGHEAVGNEWTKGYYWKGWDGTLSYGGLCAKCVPIYQAVEADSFEEAEQLLRDKLGITLQDICAGWEGAKRETKIIGGIPFDVVEIPPGEGRRGKG